MSVAAGRPIPLVAAAERGAWWFAVCLAHAILPRPALERKPIVVAYALTRRACRTQSLPQAAVPYLDGFRYESAAPEPERGKGRFWAQQQKLRRLSRQAQRYQDHPAYQISIMVSIVLVLFLSDAAAATTTGGNEGAHLSPSKQPAACICCAELSIGGQKADLPLPAQWRWTAF